MPIALGLRLSCGSRQPNIRRPAQATYMARRKATAKTNTAWCRAAAGRSPCSRYHAARGPPQPGQTKPVVYLSRQVGASPAPGSVGWLTAVYATAPAMQTSSAAGAAQTGERYQI